MRKYQEPLHLSLLSPPTRTLKKNISVFSLTKCPWFRHIVALWLLGALVGTGEKAAGQKSALRWVPTGRTDPQGGWENRSPGGDGTSPEPAQKGGSFISFNCSPKGVSAAGARQHLSFWHLSIACQVLTALLGLFTNPPASRCLFLWRKAHHYKLLGNIVEAAQVQFLESTNSFIREHNGKSTKELCVWV